MLPTLLPSVFCRSVAKFEEGACRALKGARASHQISPKWAFRRGEMHILVQNERLVETKCSFFRQKCQFWRKNAVMCRINIGAPAASPDFLKDYAAVRSVWEERPWRVAWAASKKADLGYAHSHGYVLLVMYMYYSHEDIRRKLFCSGLP